MFRDGATSCTEEPTPRTLGVHGRGPHACAAAPPPASGTLAAPQFCASMGTRRHGPPAQPGCGCGAPCVAGTPSLPGAREPSRQCVTALSERAPVLGPCLFPPNTLFLCLGRVQSSSCPILLLLAGDGYPTIFPAAAHHARIQTSTLAPTHAVASSIDLSSALHPLPLSARSTAPFSRLRTTTAPASTCRPAT
jgi:hypothetical protein